MVYNPIFSMKYNQLPHELPKLFNSDKPHFNTRLVMEKISEEAWRIFYARFYPTVSLNLGEPDIVPGTMRVGKTSTECETALLDEFNSLDNLIDNYRDQLDAGLLYFSEWVEDWYNSELLNKEYDVIHLAALSSLGISNHLLCWMYQKKLYNLRRVSEEDRSGRKLYFMFRPSIIGEYREYLRRVQ